MRVVLSKQVHEPNVRLVTGADAGKGLWRERDYQSVDAMICNTPNLPLVVFSADCGIILLHDPVHAAVGAVHAGWRGAAQGLVSTALRRMGEVFGTHPADVRAAIGAGIGPCCFETDEDVPQAMRAALGAGGRAVYRAARREVACRSQGHQRPLAPRGRRGANRRLRALHGLPPGSVLVPSPDGQRARRADRHDRAALTGDFP